MSDDFEFVKIISSIEATTSNLDTILELTHALDSGREITCYLSSNIPEWYISITIDPKNVFTCHLVLVGPRVEFVVYACVEASLQVLIGSLDNLVAGMRSHIGYGHGSGLDSID